MFQQDSYFHVGVLYETFAKYIFSCLLDWLRRASSLATEVLRFIQNSVEFSMKLGKTTFKESSMFV